MSRTILTVIEGLAKQTESSYSAAGEVRKAFILGLWYKNFPEYVLGDLNKGYHWDLAEIDKEASNVFNFETRYPNLFKFQFISNTGDSWHQCYRDLRQLGWRRLKVHRDGGRLQYLLAIEESPKPLLPKPDGFDKLHLLLDISIGTCKQVQVGTKMVEQPIFETKCEDLVELADDQEAKYSMEPELPVERVAEIVPLVVIDDVEGIEMPEGQIPRKADWDSEEFKDKAAAAFQDAQDSYFPEPASDEGSSSSQFEEDTHF